MPYKPFPSTVWSCRRRTCAGSVPANPLTSNRSPASGTKGAVAEPRGGAPGLAHGIARGVVAGTRRLATVDEPVGKGENAALGRPSPCPPHSTPTPPARTERQARPWFSRWRSMPPAIGARTRPTTSSGSRARPATRHRRGTLRQRVEDRSAPRTRRRRARRCVRRAVQRRGRARQP